MTTSMDALKKQNKELATKLTATEGRNGRKEREREERLEKEREERHERERRELIRQGKQIEGSASSVHGSRHTTVQNEGNHEKSRAEDKDNHEKSNTKRSETYRSERSHRERCHGRSHPDRSHRERCHGRSHRDRSHRERSHTIHNETDVSAKLGDLKRKYAEMADKIANGENGLTAEELMENTNLTFTDRVMNFPLPDKFKMPHIDKYHSNGDPTEHMESLRAHFILHGTPDEISC
ncbi:uncharacterized protein LOC132169435 [Corylus avellana]|uniref:uncharacterized protein LOC132169435 n=1 Tax=Corylus avellana TaxID=13451 RepID=UPI00286AF4B4|nr:uncharacterized protein LOC132169435 [Corylus avellana]